MQVGVEPFYHCLADSRWTETHWWEGIATSMSSWRVGNNVGCHLWFGDRCCEYYWFWTTGICSHHCFPCGQNEVGVVLCTMYYCISYGVVWCMRSQVGPKIISWSSYRRVLENHEPCVAVVGLKISTVDNTGSLTWRILWLMNSGAPCLNKINVGNHWIC